MANTTVGVVLSGCGYLDGSEVHESVLSLLFLDSAGAAVRCFAPDAEQASVVDHRDGGRDVSGEVGPRNVLAEAARIARGRIEPLAAADASGLDALLLPGGFGAAKNLSDFATRGAEAEVVPELATLLRTMHQAGKPIGVVCIAPAVLAAALRGSGVHVTLTVGAASGAAAAVEAMGARHQVCAVDDVVVDTDNKVVSTPAYMDGDARVAQVAAGIERLVGALLELAR